MIFEILNLYLFLQYEITGLSLFFKNKITTKSKRFLFLARFEI